MEGLKKKRVRGAGLQISVEGFFSPVQLYYAGSFHRCVFSFNHWALSEVDRVNSVSVLSYFWNRKSAFEFCSSNELPRCLAAKLGHLIGKYPNLVTEGIGLFSTPKQLLAVLPNPEFLELHECAELEDALSELLNSITGQEKIRDTSEKNGDQGSQKPSSP